MNPSRVYNCDRRLSSATYFDSNAALMWLFMLENCSLASCVIGYGIKISASCSLLIRLCDDDVPDVRFSICFAT